jgi:hypothetical protein
MLKKNIYFGIKIKIKMETQTKSKTIKNPRLFVKVNKEVSILNQKFIIQVEEQLQRLAMNQQKREPYINKLKQIERNMMFFSPVYMALAIFYKDKGLSIIDDKFLKKTANILLSTPTDDIDLRNLKRKVTINRYVRLLDSMEI